MNVFIVTDIKYNIIDIIFNRNINCIEGYYKHIYSKYNNSNNSNSIV